MRIEYDYKRNNYVGGGKVYDSDNISRHHIVSYPHMFEFGTILLAYFQILGDGLLGDLYFKRFLEYYGVHSSTNLSTIQTILKEQRSGLRDAFNYCEKNCRNFFMTVAWTDANLFTGPAGKLRADDPGQSVDGVPSSLTLNSFETALINIRMSGIIKGKPALSKGERGSINLEERKIAEIAREYIRNLPNITCPYETRVSDWLAVPLEANRSRQYDCYDIFFSTNPKNNNLEKRGYKLELAKHAEYPSETHRNQRYRSDHVVVLTEVKSTRSDDYFMGVLKEKDPAFLEQAREAIADRIIGLG